MPKLFISYNHNDGAVVEPIANTLREVFGKDDVFYDGWSIQPGDGIIDRMNSGLANATHIFFFVSKNSLASNMVKMEWQNALMREASSKCRFVPVRLDNSPMPAILTQKLYIDIYTNGLEAGIRQIVDVASGQSTYRPESMNFHNLTAHLMSYEGTKAVIEIRAGFYMEPISKYAVMLENPNATVSCQGEAISMGNRADDVLGDDGVMLHVYIASSNRATTPGFPLRLSLVDDTSLRIRKVLHAVSETRFEYLPFTDETK